LTFAGIGMGKRLEAGEPKTGVGIEPTHTAVQAVAYPVCYPVTEDNIRIKQLGIDVRQRYSLSVVNVFGNSLIASIRLLIAL
jgi:hypothetical protein